MSSRFRDNCPLDCKVYVGELGNNGTRHELEEAFGYYGPLRNVWVARNPPGFAFVMFEDPRDARDAVRALNGKVICGRRVRAELSTGKTRREMAQVRYQGSRDTRYSSGGRSPRGRSPKGRSPRDRERRDYYYRDSRDSRDDRDYYKNRSRRHRSR
ncbi:alternative splicing factor SRp20/9G8-like protein [Leptotrombidium deliense]|uniref:Alternative splicing factor SRp20/9G8-like protein n=1 Tax=Leptotrombidium deliense TaxID=299467 RepID=A0A443SKY3_9ACAR|nr:alternative splicing factor SRp20/9G8-like protein [Leptotrombidium deliense]